MSHFIEHLCVVFIQFTFIQLFHIAPADANYNAKSINNHNHDHNEHSLEWTRMRSERRAQVVSLLMKPVAERWCKTNAESIKRLKIPQSHSSVYVWNSIFNSTTQFNSWVSKWWCDACEDPQLLHLWWLKAKYNYRPLQSALLCPQQTIIYLALWTLVSVNPDEVIVTAIFESKWQFYQIYNIIFT